MRGRLASPRTRRRLVWISVVAVVCVGIAIGVLAIPNHSGKVVQHFRPGKPDLVKTQKQVPVGAADRRSIDRLLDRFVVAAVARRDPGSAWALATAALRAGTTHVDWLRGNIPVQPLRVQGSTFHGWAPSYSYRDEVNFDLLVHARPGSDFGAVSYTVDVKRVGGRWLVDEFVPSALFASASPKKGEPSHIVAAVDYGPQGQLGAPSTIPKHSGGWLTVPLLFVGLPGIGLLVAVFVLWRRHRREERIYRAA